MNLRARPPHKLGQRGNIFAMLFASVALIGVLGAVGMQTLTGPVTTVTRVTQKNIADTQLLMSAKIIVNAAITGVADGDPDGDGLIEPSPFVPAGGGESPPTNGGFLPTDLGLSLTDPWGSKYGYCVWDHGTTNASTNRLTGDNTASAPTQPVIAIIAAGPDKVFQTTCSAYSGSLVQVTKSAGSDDIHFKYSYAEASANSNGLWSVNVSDQAKAELMNAAGSAVNVSIDRDTGIGDFLGLTTGVITAKLDETIALDGGLLLDSAGATADTCTAAEKGSIRLNAAQDSIEICDGAGAFFDLTAGYWDENGNDIFATNIGNVGIGTGTPSQKLDVQGSVNISANIVAGGTGTIGGDLIVDTNALYVDAANNRVGVGKALPAEALDVVGNAAIDGDATVTGSLTVDTDTLVVDASGDKVGVGTASPAHVLDITGATDMGALGTLVPGDAVLHVDDGTANLYVDGRAIISDAGIIFGTTGANALELVTNEASRITIAADGTVSVAGNTGIGGATTLSSTLSVAGIASFDSGTLYVDVPDSRVGVGTTDPLTKLDVAGGVKIGADSLCNISKAGMVAWNTGVLQLCGADGNWASLAAIDKLDDIGDVDVPTPNNDDVLAWDGTNWIAKNIALLGPANVNPAGNDGDIQFRDGSDLGADALLHWDNTNKRLGIGMSDPGAPITVDSALNTDGVGTGTILIQGESNKERFEARSAGATPGAAFQGKGYGGTIASPTATQAGMYLAILGGGGHNGSALTIPNSSVIGLMAAENWSTSALGSYMAFETTATGSTTRSERLRIADTGNIGIGTTTPSSLLHVAGGVQLGNDTADCPGASNVKLGTLRFNGGSLQVCKASGWSGIGSGGSGSSPAFYVHKNNVNQNIPNSTAVKLTWNTEVYDTNNNFDLANGRFQPTVPGKYDISGSAHCQNVTSHCFVYIMKNGGAESYAGFSRTSSPITPVNAIVDLNGTTDYVELWVGTDGTASANAFGLAQYTWFQGALLAGGGSDTLGGLSCNSGEIAKWNGSAWACAADGGGSGSASSIVPGFPDAIACPRTDSGHNVFYLVNTGTNDEVLYVLAGSLNDWLIRFTKSTGLYKTSSGTSIATYISAASGHCLNASTNVSDLYSAGLAFNFVGGSSGGSGPIFSARAPVLLGTVYGPAATDGLLIVQGRLDGAGGLMTLTVKADTNNPPTTEVAAQHSYNSGATYYGSVFMTAPIRKGEYYRILCNGGASCGGSAVVGYPKYYFVPMQAGGDTLAGLSCASGEIPKWDGSAWECAADGGGSGGAGSMVSGWPDAITCNLTTPAWGQRYFYLHYDAGTSMLYRMDEEAAGGNVGVWFTKSTKTFANYDANLNTAAGGTAVSNCSGKTIDQLYASGQAFNFGGGSGSSGVNASPTIAFSGGGTQTVTLADGISLYQNNSRDAWTSYGTLPSYLVGTRGTDTVNGTPDGSAVTMTVSGGAALCYLMRSSAWAAVPVTGWAVKATAPADYTAFSPGIDLIYQRVFPPGSYTLDSYSAMYACSTAPVGGGADTLAGLSCASGEIVKWNGSAWACAADGGGGGGTEPCVAGGPDITQPQPTFTHYTSWENNPSGSTSDESQISNDAFPNYGWHHSPGTPSAGAPDYAAIDYGTPIRVCSLAFKVHGNPFQDFVLQGSNDSSTGANGTWTDIHSSAVTERTEGALQTFTFNNLSSYRWYRLKITSGYVGGWAMYQWKMYAHQTSTTPPGGADTQVQFNDSGAFAGAAQLFWDKVNNRLGVNIAAPTQAVDVSGAVTSDRMIFKSVAADAPLSGSTFWSSDGTDAWRAAGNVGIGTTSASSRLTVVGGKTYLAPSSASPDQGFQVDTSNQANGSNAIIVTNPSGWTGNVIKSNLDGVEVFRVNQAGAAMFKGGVASGGNGGVAYQVTQAANQHGVISTASTNGYYAIYNQALAGGSFAAGFYTQANNSTGCTLVYGATAWSCFSDSRLKKNVETIPDALGKLALLRGVTFNTLEQKKGDKKHLGVIAQEVLKAFPEAVSTVKSPGSTESYYSVEYTALIGPMISGINQLKAENDALKARVEALENKDLEQRKIDASILKRLEALEAHAMH